MVVVVDDVGSVVDVDEEVVVCSTPVVDEAAVSSSADGTIIGGSMAAGGAGAAVDGGAVTGGAVGGIVDGGLVDGGIVDGTVVGSGSGGTSWATTPDGIASATKPSIGTSQRQVNERGDGEARRTMTKGSGKKRARHLRRTPR